MFKHASLKRSMLLGMLAAIAIGALPATASAAPPPPPYAVNLTQFSKQVNGVAPPGVTTVTVDLLRTTQAADGTVVRNQVDTFTATVGAGGVWSGAFPFHSFSGANDQIEVNYSPVPSPTVSPQQLTIGGGHFLPTADVKNGTNQRVAESVSAPANSLDSEFSISYDGTTMTCGAACTSFTASVNGGGALPSTGATPVVTFVPAVTAGEPIEVTVPIATDPDGTTQINLSAPGPQLSLERAPLPIAPPLTPAATQQITGLASCQAYLVINEAVCRNLTPGSYTLTDGASVFPVTVPPVVVKPPQDGVNVQTLFVPRQAGAVVPGLAGGQTLTLSQNGFALTTLKVAPLKLSSSEPLGDLLNGANATTTGNCGAGLFLVESGTNPDLCTSGGALPSPNNLTGVTTSLSENDETSLGTTTVMLPQFTLQQPADGTALFTPFVVTAQLRYTDPLAQAAQADTPAPAVGARPVIASTASNDKAVFSYAKLGSTKFTTLGNANVAGGVQLPPTLPIGVYDGRWTVSDPAGNSYSYDITFYNEGSTSGNLAAPKCSAKAKLPRGKKGKSSVGKVTFRCTTSTGARVALWIQRGTTVVADGSGAARHGKVTIVLSGTGIKKGTYQLIEVVDLSGRSSESNKTLKLK